MDFDIELVFSTAEEVDFDKLLKTIPSCYTFDMDRKIDTSFITIYKDDISSEDLSAEIIEFVDKLKYCTEFLHADSVCLKLVLFETKYISRIVVSNIQEIAIFVTDFDIVIYPTSSGI